MIWLIRTGISVLLMLFLPGWLITAIFLKNLPLEGRICISFGLSAAIMVALGFMLSSISNITGVPLINSTWVWLCPAFVCAFLIPFAITRVGK